MASDQANVEGEPPGPSPARPGQEEDCCVRVAVHIRPLIDAELADGCQACLSVSDRDSQVFAGANSFTYDYVLGGGGQAEGRLYDSCVLPLVDGLFRGYNATVFAYGQTGSGKTYTMGSAFTPGGGERGVIPRVMASVFGRIQALPETDVTVRVGFVEIHTEDIRDLLVPDGGGRRVAIREEAGGGVCLAGATEREVGSQAEMAQLLAAGTLQRATAATGMNRHSSRSHAIFTITLEQRRRPAAAPARRPSSGGEEGDEGEESGGEEEADTDDYLCAKMHLVDLAGSERAKRTRAEGQRLREGIQINRGLLALGNVIAALSEGKAHVPYRDSKLTRMLQDSLGGNSRTLMVACVSPADVNLEESVNTLRYAARARRIRNRPVVNRDPHAAALAHLRQQLAAARAEAVALRARLGGGGEAGPGGGAAAAAEGAALAAAVEELQVRAAALDVENARLRVDLEACRQELAECEGQLLDARAQRDALALAAEPGGAAAAGAGASGVVRGHLERIARLEGEVRRLRKAQRASGAFLGSARKQPPAAAAAEAGPSPPASPLLLPDLAGLAGTGGDSLADDGELAAEERAHRLEQQQQAGELEALQASLAAKEAAMARLEGGRGGVAGLRGHYDRLLAELTAERDELQRARADLAQRMLALQASSEEDRTALEAAHRQRLADTDARLRGVAKRERKLAAMERLQARSEEACRQLQSDILATKQQKVQLVKRMEQSARDFQEWRRQREREVAALRRQGVKAAAHVQRLEALQAKQQAVLRRKTEEAEAARRRLKGMLELHQRAGEQRAAQPLAARGGNAVEAQPNPNAPLLRDDKARAQWVEHELDMACQSFEIQRVLDGEKAQRSDTARQLAEAERRAAAAADEVTREQAAAAAAGLQEELQRQSAQIMDTQQALVRARAEEEARGQAAADARRWNGLRTVVEARALLKSVFRVAAAQRAQLYEGQAEAAESREEAEVLRLKLDAAEQQAGQARQAAARAQSALAEALAAGGSPAAASPPPAQPDAAVSEVEALMRQIGSATLDDSGDSASDPGTPAQSDESEGEEDGDEWDPQHATPWRGRRRGGGAEGRRPAGPSLEALQAQAACIEASLEGARREQWEAPVLADVNAERARGGRSPAARLTVPLLKGHLRGKLVGGRAWRQGAKKREELIEDYREYLGVRDGQLALRRAAPSPRRAGPRLPGGEPDAASPPSSAGSPPELRVVGTARPPSSPAAAAAAGESPRAAEAAAAGPSGEGEATPGALYSIVKERCEAAVQRAQAMRSRLQPGPSLPPLQLPGAGGAGGGGLAAGSPSRAVLGELANGGEGQEGPPGARKEREGGALTARSRRGGLSARALGPLSARTDGRRQLTSPRPRAAWL